MGPIRRSVLSTITDYVTFRDQDLARRYASGRRKIPMTTLVEAYFDGRVDIPGDMYKFLDVRSDFVEYSITPHHLKFFVEHMIPEVTIHSKSQDERIVREHYDRGDDFFGAFLGERMIYTSGYFTSLTETLEESQDNKMDLVCHKLQLKPGERLLDIGCGWGTLTRHAAVKWGADATGVTISKNQTAFGNERIKHAGVQDRARLLCLDYRESPMGPFDKISSLEMVEHVGVKNLPKFMKIVFDRLKEDGMFFLQWTGLRRGGNKTLPVIGLRPEDLVWGLFMNEHIFPGADASLPLSGFVHAMETAGFEVSSVENVSIHYGVTIKRWHDNWLANKDTILRAYGERWFRVWHLFLAWSTRIAEQGNAACFQVVANKNLDHYNRRVFIGRSGLQWRKGTTPEHTETPKRRAPEATVS